MKKHGPPPWGRKIAGWRCVDVVMSMSSRHPGPSVRAGD
jgi:hypothetical protein